VRRLVPWLLLSMVLVGAGVGALLGTASQPPLTQAPSQWVADALAATKGARSAHFAYSSVSTSPNPDLRGALSGYGVIDFTTGDLSVSEVDHTVTFTSTDGQPTHPESTTDTIHAIVIGRTVYQANPIPGLPATGRYHVMHPPEVLASQGALSLALNASTALDSLTGNFTVASVTALGTAQINGAAATEYKVGFAPLRVCPPHQVPQTITSRPSRVWLDDAGRVVQVRSTSFFDDRLLRGVKLPAGIKADDLAQGAVTTVNTLTFSRFGARVHIAAPPADAIQSGNSVSYMILKSDACHP